MENVNPCQVAIFIAALSRHGYVPTMQKKPFAELGLSPDILKAIEKMGFEEASPIQSAAIPVLLTGADVVGQSQTGSGKTAAFAIPAIEKIDASLRAPQVLILCPTRELAVQVAEEVAKLATFKRGVRELPIYGGASYDRQIRGLKDGAQIIIGTPGRVIDHLDRGTLRLDSLKMIILDEADRMLDMGFRDDIESVLEQAPLGRQTVLFSATMPRGIQDLIRKHTRNPENVRIESQTLTMPAIDQVYYEVDRRSKLEALSRIIDVQNVKCAIIFCATKMMCDQLTEHLIARGYVADKLHGDVTQAMRERVMKRFRDRKVEFLVATDVAARGLDVEDIEVVFNYDLPHDGEDYVHRIGRTGRAGRSGRAITFVAGREIRKLENMIHLTKGRIRREKVPSVEEVEEKRTNQTFELLRETLESGEFIKRDSLIDRLLDQGYSATDIASALLHLLGSDATRSPVVEPEPIREPAPRRDSERPARFERGERSERGEDPRRGRPARDISDVSDEAGMTRLVFTAGRLSEVRPADIVGTVLGLSGIPREAIGAIHIEPKHTLVDIADEHVSAVTKALAGIRFKGRKLAVFVPDAK
ncbi:MAG: DEAD/DEAH box helicase [Terrimicrobiaceae bacterium]|nr:DEAD/DEAH box helicase [Terrimicrobiaceae bacterium]